ncbi:hypothetical protein [Glycomyces buryatensis]|uniref:Uncharacterized protein n=1 Tax=Glycomyces buryatensis TaxID=2570927 RepID=A0A4V4HSF3_9ACTN|nr:hypothetical protein [Glycomyces buryatensis]THV41396.1 hypothetical protein FAB82_11385 [Glycomyces buryatensis]
MSLENATREEIQRVKASVVACLGEAGIPWFEGFNRPGLAAAQVTVEMDEGERGVFINWFLARSDSAQAMMAWKTGAWDDLGIDRTAQMEKEGVERISDILMRAGIPTRDTDDVADPFTLEVVWAP